MSAQETEFQGYDRHDWESLRTVISVLADLASAQVHNDDLVKVTANAAIGAIREFKANDPTVWEHMISENFYVSDDVVYSLRSVLWDLDTIIDRLTPEGSEG